MITSRGTRCAAAAGTIKPPFVGRASAVMARSISPAPRTSIGRTSTPSDGAKACIAPNWPGPAATAGVCRNATRFTPGAISLSSSNHLAPMPYSNSMKPVALPPGRARVSTKPAPTGSANHEHDRHGTGRLQQGPRGCAANSQDDVGRECNQFRCVSANALGVARAPTDVNPSIAAVDPARLRERLRERQDVGLLCRIVRRKGCEHPDAPHPLTLLCACRERPRVRAADQRDELAALHAHSITSSARASRLSGKVSPSALAVLRLI